MSGATLPNGVTVFRGRERFTGEVPDGIIKQVTSVAASAIISPVAAPATAAPVAAPAAPKPAPDAETAEAKK